MIRKSNIDTKSNHGWIVLISLKWEFSLIPSVTLWGSKWNVMQRTHRNNGAAHTDGLVFGETQKVFICWEEKQEKWEGKETLKLMTHQSSSLIYYHCLVESSWMWSPKTKHERQKMKKRARAMVWMGHTKLSGQEECICSAVFHIEMREGWGGVWEVWAAVQTHRRSALGSAAHLCSLLEVRFSFCSLSQESDNRPGVM